MGIVPEMTAEERAEHNRILDSAFGESRLHLALLAASHQKAADADQQAARDAALNESFGEGPIAVALAGRQPTR